MHKLNEDCFYFLTASCTKGNACSYRHNPLAIQSQTVCSAWSNGTCTDTSCSLRHTNVPIVRSTNFNAPPCFFETTSSGCLKPDCTFAHIRPRMNLRNPANSRPTTTNLVNKDLNKTNPSSNLNVPVTKAPDNIPECSELQKEVVKPEVPISSKPEDISNERKETSTRSIVTTVSTENFSQETKMNGKIQSSLATNRSVVVNETNNRPHRTIVLSSENARTTKTVTTNNKKNSSDSDSDLDDFINDENPLPASVGKLDISFPCSTKSMTNRLFVTSKTSTVTSSNTDTKPIRLRRDPIPVINSSKANSENNNKLPTNGKITSAGTDLTEEEKRRKDRLERFKKKVNSPPRIADTNERKRPSEKHSRDDSRPAKRHSTSTSQHEKDNHRRSRTIEDLCSPPSNSSRRNTKYSDYHVSPPRAHSILMTTPNSVPTFSSSSCITDTAWQQEVEIFLARTAIVKKPPPTVVEPTRIKHSKSPVRSTTPLITNNESVLVEKNTIIPNAPQDPPAKETPINTDQSASTLVNMDEDEDELLELHAPSDIVDTFALIDEALIETELFELS